jgi:hypothetical protein
VGRYAQETVVVGTAENIVDIVFRRAQPLTLRLNRESYRYDDRGVIEVYNQSGVNLDIEVACADKYIHFPARKHVAGARYEIPFTVKLTTLMSAQLLFRKTPFMRTVIEAKTVCHGRPIRLRLPIIVGEW